MLVVLEGDLTRVLDLGAKSTHGEDRIVARRAKEKLRAQVEVALEITFNIVLS